MPLYGTIDFFESGFSDQIGGVGNLSIILKRLMLHSRTAALAGGLGVSVPTGEDAQVRVADDLFTVRNQAVHLFPFMGFLAAPTERTFYQGFMQLDIPTSSNSLEVRDVGSGSAPRSFGSVDDQLLFYLDMSFGYWLYRNPSYGRLLTGVAPAVELHYTTAFENAATLAGSTHSCGGCTNFELGNSANRFDVVNVNGGLYTTWLNRFIMYMGVVSPLGEGTNRFFDMEAQTSLNYLY